MEAKGILVTIDPDSKVWSGEWERIEHELRDLFNSHLIKATIENDHTGNTTQAKGEPGINCPICGEFITHFIYHEDGCIPMTRDGECRDRLDWILGETRVSCPECLADYDDEQLDAIGFPDVD